MEVFGPICVVEALLIEIVLEDLTNTLSRLPIAMLRVRSEYAEGSLQSLLNDFLSDTEVAVEIVAQSLYPEISMD